MWKKFKIILVCLLCYSLGMLTGHKFIKNDSNSEKQNIGTVSLENGTYSNDPNLIGTALSVEDNKFVLYEESVVKSQGEIIYDKNNTFNLKCQNGDIYTLYAIDSKDVLVFINKSIENILRLKQVTPVIVNYPQEGRN